MLLKFLHDWLKTTKGGKLPTKGLAVSMRSTNPGTIPSEGKKLVLSFSYQSPLRLGVGIGIPFRIIEWFFWVVALIFILTPLGRGRRPPLTRMSDIGALVNKEDLVVSR
jgi:hypothetical protein